MSDAGNAITLYDYELSAGCYTVRLMLSLLGVSYHRQAVAFYPAGEHRQPGFRAINRMAELPVLDHGDLRLRETAAILVHLAEHCDPGARWFPAPARAVVVEWLLFSRRLELSLGALRLQAGFFIDCDDTTCRRDARVLLRHLDECLWFGERQSQQWLIDKPDPSLADIACFAPVMLAEEGDVSLQDYPAIRRWTDRVRNLPGFVVMPGIFPGNPHAQAAPR